MLLSQYAFSEAAFSELPDALSSAIPSAFSAITDDDDLIYLYEGQPYDPAAAVVSSGLPPPAGMAPTTQWDLWGARGETILIRLSDRGYATGPSEDPANAPYPNRLASVFNASLRIGGSRGLGGGSRTTGEVRIGEWQSLAEQGWDLPRLAWSQRPFVIKAGRPGDPLFSFGVAFEGRHGGARWDRADFMLSVLDPNDRLGQLSLPTFAGTEGAEGPADLKGLTKPWTLGLQRQVPGQAVNEPLHIFQWSYRAIKRFLALRVRGSEVTSSDVDHATYEALAAATVPSGEYHTCLALGMARLGTAPDGQPTADLEGDSEGGYVSTLGAIVRRIVTELLPSGQALSDPGEIDAVAFAQLDLEEPGTAGVHIPTDSEPPSARDLVDQLLVGAGAWWTFDLSGQLFVGFVGTPKNPAVTIGQGEIDDRRAIEALRGEPPAWRVKVGYRRMVEPLRREDLAGGLTDDEVSLFTQEFRFPAPAESASTRSRNPDAEEIELSSPFDEEAAAAKAQARLLAWLKKRPQKFSVPLTRGRFQYQLAQVIAIQDARVGLSEPMSAWVTGIDRDASTGALSIEAWGAPPSQTSELPPAAVSLVAPPRSIDFLSDPSDGYLYTLNASYEDARAGPAFLVVDASATLLIGQGKSAGNFFVIQGFLRFKTGIIGLSATIDSAKLEIAGNPVSVATPFTLEARALTWSEPLVVSDFVAGASLGSLPLLASVSVPLAADDAYIELADTALADHINKTGDTTILLSSSHQRTGTPPGAGETSNLSMRSGEALSLRPRLTVITS